MKLSMIRIFYLKVSKINSQFISLLTMLLFIYLLVVNRLNIYTLIQTIL